MAQQVESKNRATSSEESRAAVLAACKTEGVESMLLWFNDLEGHLKSFAITPGELAGGPVGDGLVAQEPDFRVVRARPVARLDPSGALEHRAAKARAVQEREHVPVGGLAARLGLGQHTALVGILGLAQALDQHVEIAHRAEFMADTAQG